MMMAGASELRAACRRRQRCVRVAVFKVKPTPTNPQLRIVSVTLAVLALLSVAAPTALAAQVSLTWSKPVVVDPTGGPNHSGGYLDAVACASSTQCTAVDGGGTGEVTFDPFHPESAHLVTIDSQPMAGVACPSLTQCTAVDTVGSTRTGGREVTFNPQNPGTPTPVTIYAVVGPDYVEHYSPTAVACPSQAQCTAVLANGGEVTFNPLSPGVLIATAIDSNLITGLACPTLSLCVAVDNYGGEVTFNPQSPGSPARTVINTTIPSGQGQRLLVACPTVAQCTAVSSYAGAVTFDPQAPIAKAPRELDSGHELTALACPSLTDCVTMDFDGQAIEWDPTANSPASVQVIGGSSPGAPGTDSPGAVTCPTSQQCVAVDFKGQEITGTPGGPSSTTGSGEPGPKAKITNLRVDRKHHKAKFTFKGSRYATRFQCALIKRGKTKTRKPHFSRCRSPKTYKHLKSGRYTFAVRALSQNKIGPIATLRFTI